MRLDSFNREFGMSLLVVSLTLWEMCGLCEESVANFREFTPRLRIVDCGAFVLGLQKTP